MTKQLKLAYLGPLDPTKGKGVQYKVISVKNSVAYNPGTYLEKIEVSDLCERHDWDVVILPFEDRNGRKP